MMQAPLPTPPAMDATRAKQKKILIKLVNRGGDPSLLKKLEELEAGKTLSEQEMAELTSSIGTQSREGSPRPESMVDKLTSASSSSRRISRSRSRQRRRSRSRSPERGIDQGRHLCDLIGTTRRDIQVNNVLSFLDYYRSSRGSRRRSHSRSRYSRSSRYEEDYARYDYREREREREMGRRSGRSYDEAGRDRERSERERERERGREPEKDRERERDRDRERHRSSRSGDGEKREKSSRESRDSGADVRMKSPEEARSTPDKMDE